MKHLKMLGLAALSAMALMSIGGVGAASATTLEVGGLTKNESVVLTLSYKAGTSGITRDTFGFSTNTCTGSHAKGKAASPFTGSIVTGPVEELSYSGCEHTITVHSPGQLYIEWTSGTNGRVYSENTELTMFSTIHGTHLPCRTGTGTPIGTLTGVAAGQATIDINATLNCGPHLSSAKWLATYIVTSPDGLGVSP